MENVYECTYNGVKSMWTIRWLGKRNVFLIRGYLELLAIDNGWKKKQFWEKYFKNNMKEEEVVHIIQNRNNQSTILIKGNMKFNVEALFAAQLPSRHCSELHHLIGWWTMNASMSVQTKECCCKATFEAPHVRICSVCWDST